MPLQRQLAGAVALALITAACGPGEPSGPVRTALQAGELAQRSLRSAGLDEQIIDARRQDGHWLVVTRWRETSMAGHLVTVDAKTGAVTVERYRSVQLGRQR